MLTQAVRHKVKELIGLISDDERLREERKKAKQNKDKYSGVSVDDVVSGNIDVRFMSVFVVSLLLRIATRPSRLRSTCVSVRRADSVQVFCSCQR